MFPIPCEWQVKLLHGLGECRRQFRHWPSSQIQPEKTLNEVVLEEYWNQKHIFKNMCIFKIYTMYIYIYSTVERHYIKHGHTLQSYRSSSFPIASHSPGTLFLNASIRLRKIACTSCKYQILTIKILCSSHPRLSSVPSQWPLPKTSGFGFSHHAVCCFPVTFDLTRGPLTGSNLVRKFFSMQFRAEGILQARLARTEKGMKSKSMEEENRRKDGGFPNPWRGADYFHHFGVTGIAPGIALKPWIPLSSPCFEPSISTACLAVKKPRETKDQGSGRTKERQQKRREGERDGWQRRVASDPQPSTRIPP